MISNPDAVDKRYSLRFNRKFWPHIFYSAFLHQCPRELKGCTINFDDHRFPSAASGNEFCEIMGHCGRTGRVECKMRYKFLISNVPAKNEDVPVKVMYVSKQL